jgi:IS30 family transposase
VLKILTDLIRHFFPKGANFDNISAAQIAVTESWTNNRPRKCLKYSTPLEVFNSSVALAT